MSSARGRVELGLIGFLLSALFGAAVVAYDTSTAVAKFGLISGGVLVAYALMRLPTHAVSSRGMPVLRIVVAALPALVALYFLIANDWSQPADKVTWLDRLSYDVAQGRVPFLPALHPNIAGGVLAMLLPLQAAALFSRPAIGRGISTVCLAMGGVALLALSGTALLATRLRGAWLALIVAGTLWLVGRASASVRQNHPRAAKAGVVGLASGLVLLVLGVVLIPQWAAARPDRWVVWSNSWHLAWDYAVTGLGLGSFTMPYSSYALLVHVPHTTHAHNLFLDIWLEQGIVGLLAFLWIAAAAVVPRSMALGRVREPRPRKGEGWWQPAATISTLVVLFHGLIDDSYYGYGGVGALFLFVPIALASRREHPGPPHRSPHRTAGSRLVPAAAAAALMLIAALPSTRAAYHANLGALWQTRAELAVYSWPAWAVQDVVRRSGVVDLTAAIDQYRAAVALDPDNAVANRRLGQIELSLGRYDAARAHLETAHRASPSHRATRQMLGESLALTGDIGAAARVWHDLPLEQDQLAIRAAWHESTGDVVGARRMHDAIAHSRPPAQ